MAAFISRCLCLVFLIESFQVNAAGNVGGRGSEEGRVLRDDRIHFRDPSQHSPNSSKVTVKKCCPWGTSFDPDDLTCKRRGIGGLIGKGSAEEMDEFLRLHVKNGRSLVDVGFSIGVPPCSERKVFVSRFATAFSLHSNRPELDGSAVAEEYCIDESYGNGTTVLSSCMDPSRACRLRPCIRKCKSYGEFFGLEVEDVLEYPPIRPEFHDPKTMKRDPSATLSGFGLYFGNRCGDRGRHILSPEESPEDVNYLGTDGRLYLPNFDKRRFYTADEFCIEYVISDNFSEVRSFLCFAEPPSNLKHYLLTAGFVISCVCFLATFLVYLLSPKSQNLYGKSLMCYVASLFFAYLTLAVIEVHTENMGEVACTFTGYTTLFFFLAAFFWLNIMSYDIWKRFRCVRSAHLSNPAKERIQFLWYSLYAWSGPSLLTGFCAAADFVPDFAPPSIKPRISEETCWFSKRTNGIHVFFIAPISIVIICNTILYVSTAWRCWKIKSEIIRMGNHSRRKYSANKTQLVINGKLFIVMGVVWSLEVISFFAEHPIWYITDAANALHGLFIFIIFVLKKKVLAGLPERIKSPFIRMKGIKRKSDDDSGLPEDVTSHKNMLRSSSTNVTDLR